MAETTTQSDIAERAGVSRPVVSAVLSGLANTIRCSPGTAERIRRIATEMGYRPNYHARALQSGRSDCIGLVLWRERPGPGPGITPFWYPFLSGIEAGTRQERRDLLVIGPRAEGDAVDQAVRYAIEGRIDALVVPGHLEADEFERLRDITAVPVVLACNDRRDLAFPMVDVDDAAGMRMAVEHLHQLGHRHLLYLDQVCHRTTTIMQRRRQATRAICRQRGMRLSTRRLIAADDDGHPGRQTRLQASSAATIAATLRSEPRITAILSATEPLAFASYRAAAICGYRIGKDVSIIGFDNQFADTGEPPLAAIDHMLADVAQAAASLACRLCDRQERQAEPILIPPVFHKRPSCGPIEEHS